MSYRNIFIEVEIIDGRPELPEGSMACITSPVQNGKSICYCRLQATFDATEWQAQPGYLGESWGELFKNNLKEYELYYPYMSAFHKITRKFVLVEKTSVSPDLEISAEPQEFGEFL